MADTRDATPVRDDAGETGWLDGPFVPDAPAEIRLGSGQRLRLAAGLVEQTASGALRTRVSFSDLVDLTDDHPETGAAQARTIMGVDDSALPATAPGTEVFQEIRESLAVRRVVHEAERVRVSVVTGSTSETVREPTWSEAVQVRRVPVGEVVTEMEDVRTEAGETIIPVYEEVLVVERRLVLRERLHVSVERETTETEQEVVLRHQSIDVERVPANAQPASGMAGP